MATSSLLDTSTVQRLDRMGMRPFPWRPFWSTARASDPTPPQPHKSAQYPRWTQGNEEKTTRSATPTPTHHTTMLLFESVVSLVVLRQQHLDTSASLTQSANP